jgi:hypothetical protein
MFGLALFINLTGNEIELTLLIVFAFIKCVQCFTRKPTFEVLILGLSNGAVVDVPIIGITG